MLSTNRLPSIFRKFIVADNKCDIICDIISVQGDGFLEKIGVIIRNHRIALGLTQEEVGNKVFVSKQAVSKWETGKTLPDLEMLRKLCDILQISKDEILGGSIEETKKNRKWLKMLAVISVISILIALFFGLGGVDYIDRHTQSSVAYVAVFMNGEVLSTEEYQIEGIERIQNYVNGYKFDIDYGTICGIVHLSREYEIEFGFVNTNNWHNIHIRLDVNDQNGLLTVRQTVSYETDNNIYEVLENEKTATDRKTSVFREGV